MALDLSFSYSRKKVPSLSCPRKKLYARSKDKTENDFSVRIHENRLKGLNLTGELPDEFAQLTHLGDINLSHNYISGTIPKAFGQLSVYFLYDFVRILALHSGFCRSLLGNRLHGLIPAELANVTTLEELLLEDNLLEGPLPQNFGNLIGLRRFILSANKFNGTIPETFGNLKNLTDFRIDGNEFSGKIPDFIGNWTNITRLDLQGTGLEGPIPSSISSLKNITELRISDLSGANSTFPDLKDMQLHVLILKNCLIKGAIPEYLGGFSELKILDLSFNSLSGQIPDSMASLNLYLKFMFLSHNSLTGEIPSWITGSEGNFDLSYNNFTRAADYNCQPSKVNLASSMSSSESNSVAWCLKKDLPCSRKSKHHSLFINCGGTTTDWGGHEYEEDLVPEGPSYFSYYSSEKWAYSSTGVFLNNDRGNFLAMNNNMSEEIYKTARLAPSSLKYYGLCLRSGSYKVRLHFAEIQYSDDMTYNSIGRRIFDVSIQGKLIRKNFNIAEEAKGFGKAITLDNDVTVVNGTLEIHLYWAGKGTTLVPDRGVYGPLISAITVTPNFHVETGDFSTETIVGIVVGAFVIVILILLVLWKTRCLGKKDVEDKELRQAIESRTAYFSLRQIKAATNDFDCANKIGEGGFGPVYKGVLPDDAEIAVKQLSPKSKQGTREFINELGMIVAVQHPNLVKLVGCCIEGDQLLLVYEHMENNSLARALFGREEQLLNLDWPSRKKIFLQIARGLTYLHEESRLKIVHRDIKATNVLLDRDLNAKIGDFGLAKLDSEEKTHISTRIAGTIGYMAPEYAMRGYLTDKADVYSFGIVALEIVSGKSNNNFRPIEEFMNLLDWAYVLQEQGNLLDLVDPILGSNYSKKEALRMLNLALMCTNPSPTLRPSMSTVISKFQGKKRIRAPIVNRATEHAMSFKSFDNISLDSRTQSSSEESREERTLSISDSCRAYSMSARSNHADMDNYTPETKILQSA
nr:PREDICTED: probable LRR receptor-like serine/threonine-protein kinase At1g53440 [Daucus carota subsp. sativus]